MIYRLIEKGTMFNLEFGDKLTNAAVSHKGFLHVPARDIVLLVEGDKLHNYCAQLPPGSPVALSFYRGANEFAFEGKIDGAYVKDNVKLTEITAIGIISERLRRATRRFTVTVGVELYPQKHGADTAAACVGQSYDISCDALSIWSNDDIEVTGATYNVKFTLFNRENFSVPAKILRKRHAPATSFFKHDYVMLFDFESEPKEKNRLLDTFIKNSLELNRL